MRRMLAMTLAVAAVAGASAPAHADDSARGVICGLIDQAASDHALPASFLTRLLWRESSFRAGARSPVGAQGIAQFMPATAAERGLVDPFDPALAIPASASYLAELRQRFGTLDLAAAAYNAGPNRIARWQAGAGALPNETVDHVRFVTGAELDSVGQPAPSDLTADAKTENCLATLASLTTAKAQPPSRLLAEAVAPWGIQLIAGPSKERALRDYAAMQKTFSGVLGDQRPTILTTRLGGRGARFYYRIRVAFDQRASADALCRRLRQAGGACLTVRN